MTTTTIMGVSWNELAPETQLNCLNRLCFLQEIIRRARQTGSDIPLRELICGWFAKHEQQMLMSLALPRGAWILMERLQRLHAKKWKVLVRACFDGQKPFELIPCKRRRGVMLPEIEVELTRLRDGLIEGFAEQASFLGLCNYQLKEVALRYAAMCLNPAGFQMHPCDESDAPGIENYRLFCAGQINALTFNSLDRHLEALGEGDRFTITELYKRCCDSRFIFRRLRKGVVRAREMLFLRLGLIGHRGEKYSSSRATRERVEQQARMAQWMKDTQLIDITSHGTPDGTTSLTDTVRAALTLADCGQTKDRMFAKLYTFAKAIDAISEAEGLSTALLTLTMPPQWHPNPMYGPACWNGESPLAANEAIRDSWKEVQQNLHKRKIGITGLRVIEPHQDGCPHWHIWVNYRKEFEVDILSEVMKAFPGQLKYRTAGNTRIYDSMVDFKQKRHVTGISDKTSTRVDFAVIDRSISSGATYLMKYLLKTMKTGELNRKGMTPEQLSLLDEHEKRQESENGEGKLSDNENRIDAFRGIWNLRSYDFFGLARCLRVWDELRRHEQRPEDKHFAKLWALARGGNKEGKITAGSDIRGDALGFIRALGCMRAVSFEPTGTYYKIGLLHREKRNCYGEEIQEVVGLRLFLVEKKQVPSEYVNQSTGEVKTRNRLKWVKTEICSLVTKLRHWVLRTARATKADAKPGLENVVSRSPETSWRVYPILREQLLLWPEEFFCLQASRP